MTRVCQYAISRLSRFSVIPTDTLSFHALDFSSSISPSSISTSPLRPLIPYHQPLEHSFLIRTTPHYQETEFTHWIESQLSPPTDEHALADEASSVSELLCRFLAFETQHIAEGEEDPKGTYQNVFQRVQSELESHFLHGHHVAAAAAPLPGPPAKRLNAVKSYSTARLAASL